MKTRSPAPNVLPGFGLTMGYTIIYLSLIALIPLSTLILKTAGMGWGRFWHVVASPRVVAAYELSIGASLAGATINSIFGMLVAWTLVRYRFFGRSIIDALVDLPFALPTSVAGITLTAVYSANGWLGRLLAPAGIKVAFTPLGVIVALTFVGLPFVVRTVQPVLQELEPELEEAAATLGASRLQTFTARDRTRALAGTADRVCARLRPCARRIRLGGFHFGQHADANRGGAVADHDRARTIRLPGSDGDRTGDAVDVIRDAFPDQSAAAMECEAPCSPMRAR